MHDIRRPTRPGFTVRIAVASLAIVTMVTVSGCALVSMSDAWSRAKIDLLTFTPDSPDPSWSSDPEWPYLDATDLTAEVCGSEVDCVQAVGNEYLTLLKFGSVGAATDYAEILGTDAVQIDPLVVHFDGTELSTETREGIIYTLSSDNASSPD